MSKPRLLVLGAGPAGYPAAFRAAEIGFEVTLLDRADALGGVCLHRGCIPSKALLHAASILQTATEAKAFGIEFGAASVDRKRLLAWKQGVIETLSGGLRQLCRTRGVTFRQGEARFTDPRTVELRDPDGSTASLAFDHALLATGSLPIPLKGAPSSPRIMDSTGALALDDIPGSMLVIGGGYIGLELGQAYAAFGTQVEVVEMLPTLLPGVDPDLSKVLHKTLEGQFRRIRLATRVELLEDTGEQIRVRLVGEQGESEPLLYDRVLVAIGRRPQTEGLQLDAAGVTLGKDGFVEIDAHCRTRNPSILAAGDVAGQPMLAHKATHEALGAIEALHDGKPCLQPRTIPAVVFTSPELAWCGLTEDEARRRGDNIRRAVFPWSAAGRAHTLGHPQGLTKLVAEADTGRILGVAIAGPGAGELIGEAALAIEMGAVAEDLARTVHPHPTLSETLMDAAAKLMADRGSLPSQ